MESATTTAADTGWDFRSFLALLMALVATCGALTAYRAASAADEVSGATRLLDEGQILELNRRQYYLDSIARSALYEQSADMLRTEALVPDPLNRLSAPESLAAERLTQRYQRFYHYWDPQNYSLEGAIERKAFEDLGDLGFYVTWQPQYNQSKVEPDIWADKEAENKSLGWDFTLLAAAVVLFVLALFFLTIADLSTLPRQKGWLAGGIAAATVAGIFVLWRLHDAGTITLALAGYAAGGVLAVKLFSMISQDSGSAGERSAESPDVPAAELDPTEYIGSRLINRKANDSLSRSVVVAIAVTALISAGCAYLYSVAAANMYEASNAAVTDQANGLRESTRNRAAANLLIDRVARVQQDWARLDAANQAVQLENEGLLALPMAAVKIEEQRRDQILLEDARALKRDNDSTTVDLVTSRANRLSIYNDAEFPILLLNAKAIFAGDVAFAMWDAHNQDSFAYQKQMSRYLACLTFFAISLYLFGQCMGIDGFRAKRILAGMAAVFAVVGTGLTIAAALSTIPLPHFPGTAKAGLPAECTRVFRSYEEASQSADYLAAEHYACGSQLERLARVPADYRQAADEYGLAVAYRPNFALADYDRAENLEDSASPQAGTGFRTLPGDDVNKVAQDTEAEQRAVDDLHAQGFDSPELIASLGYALFERGLLTKNRADLSEAAARTDEALADYARLGNLQGWAVMNQALLLAARGRLSQADAAYARLADPKVTTNADMALGGLTDLEFLNAQCGNVLDDSDCKVLAARLPLWKAAIVSAVPEWKQTASPSDPPALVTDSAQAMPGGAAWAVHVAHGARGASVVAIWYKFDPTWKVWVAQPQLEDNDDLPALNAQASTGEFKSALPGANFQECLGGGNYRVDFYVHGQPAGGIITPVDPKTLDGFAPNFDPRLNLALCSPPGWVRNDKTSEDGVYTWMYSRDRRSALLLARRDVPQTIGVSDMDRIAARELSMVMSAPVVAAGDPPCAAPGGWHTRWYEVRGRSVVVENRVDYDGELYEGFFIAPGARPDLQQCATASSLAEFEVRAPTGGLADQAGVTPPVRGVYAGYWGTGTRPVALTFGGASGQAYFASGLRAHPQRQSHVHAGVRTRSHVAFHARPRRQNPLSRSSRNFNNFMHHKQKSHTPPERKRP
ncbi:MAG TPA: hypothetical protein VKR56_09875 [Candidatus Cybelea sp.]|nr:hypothetical protein [Candidatus Cybelea sp.]